MPVAVQQCVMQTDRLRATVIPELGGKIASLVWMPASLELLQQPLLPFALRTPTMPFDQSDASGIDECLPSVAECDVTLDDRVIHVPDHGDFWRLAWESRQWGNELHMAATGFTFPLRFERTLFVCSQGDSDILDIDYRLINVGEAPVEYLWSAHPLFAADPGDRIVLPESVTQVRVENSAQQRLGERGDLHPWPHTLSVGGTAVDLGVAGSPAEGAGDKIFMAAPPEGWAALVRQRHGLRIEVIFDPEECPWLGLWLCYGGWPQAMPERQQCVAMEPCTAAADSLAAAIEKRMSRRLDPSRSDAWSIRIRVAPALP